MSECKAQIVSALSTPSGCISRRWHFRVSDPAAFRVRRLYLGAENWPFPVPLVSKNGRWQFDSVAGAQEVLFRRIGENESIAIQTCHALILAGKGHEGEAIADDPIDQYAGNLVTELVRNAAAAPDNKQLSAPLYGYNYRAERQGRQGIALYTGTAGRMVFLAYPARYRSTGVMTFVVIPDSLVYEKDLGPDTAEIAEALTSWKPDSTWHIAESQP
jgi:hypothetical protein